jgi:hypothetical protein
MRWRSWTFIGLGVWLLLSPWVLGFSALNLPLWNNVLCGILLTAASLSLITPPSRGD